VDYSDRLSLFRKAFTEKLIRLSRGEGRNWTINPLFTHKNPTFTGEAEPDTISLIHFNTITEDALKAGL